MEKGFPLPRSERRGTCFDSSNRTAKDPYSYCLKRRYLPADSFPENEQILGGYTFIKPKINTRDRKYPSYLRLPAGWIVIIENKVHRIIASRVLRGGGVTSLIDSSSSRAFGLRRRARIGGPEARERRVLFIGLQISRTLLFRWSGAVGPLSAPEIGRTLNNINRRYAARRDPDAVILDRQR